MNTKSYCPKNALSQVDFNGKTVNMKTIQNSQSHSQLKNVVIGDLNVIRIYLSVEYVVHLMHKIESNQQKIRYHCLTWQQS